MKKKKILVTGGAGFIGSQVNAMLNDEGYETIVFDNLSRGNKKAVLKGTFVKGDLGNQEDVEALFKEHSFDAVMHFAAFTDVGESVLEPHLYYKNNVVNTLHLLDAMHKHKVKILIFSSSAAVYGVPHQEKISEKHPCDPINPYGETKLMVEKILKDYDRAYGLRSCSFRYFNAAGGDPKGILKNYKLKENNLIPIALKAVKDKGSLTIFGTDYPTKDGTCVRDYIHVADLGRAHITAMEKLFDGALSAVYNLGNGSGYSIFEVVAAVEKVTGKKLDVIKGVRRPGDPPYLVADAALANKKLGWEPLYPSLEAMIGDAWKALA